jgi:Mannosyltransferase (PIG-V)
MTAIQAAEVRPVTQTRGRVVRLVLGVIGAQSALAAAAIFGAASQVGGVDEGIGGIGPQWLRGWTTYDANWYVAIARDGYASAPTTAFFPVLPMLMRVASPLVGLVTGTEGDVAIAISGIAISIVAFAVALGLIYRETVIDHGEPVARRTVLLIALLPFALTWQTVYTESLTLLLLAVMWWGLKRERSGVALAAAVLLGATRSIGVPIGLGLLVASMAGTIGPTARRRPIRWRLEPLAGAACLVSSAAVLVWLGRLGGGVGAQAQFGRSRSWPWVPVWRDLTGVGGYQLGSITSLLAIAVGVGYVCARSQSVAWRVAVGVTLLMHLVMARQFPAYTIGAARYLMPMYPVWAWCARRTSRIRGPVLVGAGALVIPLALFCAYSAGQGAFNLG